MHQRLNQERHDSPFFELFYLPAFDFTPDRAAVLMHAITHLKKKDIDAIKEALEDSPSTILIKQLIGAAVSEIRTFANHPQVETLWDGDRDHGVTMPLWVTGGLSFLGEAPTNPSIPMQLLSHCGPLVDIMMDFAVEDSQGPLPK